MFFFIFGLVFFMVVFPNVLFYVVSLLFFSVCVLMTLVSTSSLSSLSGILMATVYLGAMMILIGYICAVTPNLLFDFSAFTPTSIVIFIFAIVLETTQSSLVKEFKTSYLLDYFFSPWGVFLFVIVVLMLFFVLLMVTSQYSLPQAPFRSL